MTPTTERATPSSTLAAPVPGWFAVAFERSVVRRSLGYAIVVGTILVAINHGHAILSGDLPTGRLGQMLLTVAVPYIVSTSSSVGAVRQAARDSASPIERP